MESSSTEIIKRAATKLKSVEKIKPPEWANFVKTGCAKERPPQDKDWWYMRSASILRKISNLGPIGTNKLRTKYSSRKNRGHKPEHVYKGSGSIIRKILQQLESAGLIKQVTISGHKGRVITSKGTSLLQKDESRRNKKEETRGASKATTESDRGTSEIPTTSGTA